MGKVGLIINPMAGRDIRRLVAHASLQSSPEKVLMIRRLLAGMAAVMGTEVLMAVDREGLAESAAQAAPVPVTLVADSQAYSGEQETTAWSAQLMAAGSEILVVVGGDGTQRNVAQAQPSIPVLPVAGGTNNVACWTGDQTVAGFAAACYADRLPDKSRVCQQAKLLHVRRAVGPPELALIDVALARPKYTGAQAVWRSADVVALVLAVADPLRPGLSNVGGMVLPITQSTDGAIAIEVGGVRGSPIVPAVLAPGLMTTFLIRSARSLALGEPTQLQAPDGGTLALDGERTVVLAAGESVEVVCERDGPWIFSPARMLTGLRY